MTRAVGRSTSDDTKAKAVSRVAGESKIREFVAMRMKPDKTRTERANGSGPVANWVSQRAYSACSVTTCSKCAQIKTLTSGSRIACYLAQSNRASSSSASRDLGLSRSTPGRTRAPRVVIKVNAGVSDGTCRFRASSKTLEMNALTLSFRAAAARRTWFPRRSSSDIVVLMVQSITIDHQCINMVRGCGSVRSTLPGDAGEDVRVPPSLSPTSVRSKPSRESPPPVVICAMSASLAPKR